jgi:hypothetical protein
MKKILVAALAVSAISAMAETKPYFGASVGYALGQPSGNLGYERSTSATGSITSINNKYGTLGGNMLPISAHAGIMDNSVVGAEIAATYILGLEQETGKVSGIASSTDKTTLSGMLLAPSIVIAAKGPFTPYAKFGVLLGFGMQAVTKTTGDYTEKDEYSGGTAFGFQGALGGEFKAPGQDKLGFTVELAAQSLKWAPTEDKNTDDAGTVTTKSLVDEHSISTKNESNKPVMDLSNLAIKVGFNYHM